MKIAVFSSKPYDCRSLELANVDHRHEITHFDSHLDRSTVSLAAGYPAVCVFVNDTLDESVIKALAAQGTKLIALRCAGFNNVDVRAATSHGITVVRVPAYSPHAVAEHTVALILTLNRQIHRAYNRVREGNFALDGLLGFDLFGRTVGIIGTGKIGIEVAKIMKGFGCTVLAHDLYPNPAAEALGVRMVTPDKLFSDSDIISLHCPLTQETRHLIDSAAIERMKDGVMLINTSRGALIDTAAAIVGLKSGKIGYLGLDVYEEEADLFFEDLSNTLIKDDTFARLLTFPNVVITGHQAFFTAEALSKIAETTLHSVTEFEETGTSTNQIGS